MERISNVDKYPIEYFSQGRVTAPTVFVMLELAVSNDGFQETYKPATTRFDANRDGWHEAFHLLRTIRHGRYTVRHAGIFLIYFTKEGKPAGRTMLARVSKVPSAETLHDIASNSAKRFAW